MEPLSTSARRGYFVILVLLFVVLVPATILYSAGYRFGEGFSIVRTGGIYVGLGESGARLIVDGKPARGVGILKNGFFIQDLTPRVYHVVVEKEGFNRWEKVLVVSPQRVAEASAFILPKEIPFVPIAQFLEGTGNRTANPNYTELAALFATTTTQTSVGRVALPDFLATSTQTAADVKRKGDVVLWREGETVYARWASDSRNAPSYFCEEGRCDKEIPVNRQPVDFFDFYSGSNELLVLVGDRGVVVTEIDPRIPRNEHVLYENRSGLVRVVNDSVFIKDGERILRADL